MKIYTAAPITGLSDDEVMGYYRPLFANLTEAGYEVLCPMTGKDHLRGTKKFAA